MQQKILFIYMKNIKNIQFPWISLQTIGHALYYTCDKSKFLKQITEYEWDKNRYIYI